MDYTKIKAIRTVAFPVDLSECPGGNWTSNQVNLGFNPDVAIVKSIGYNDVIPFDEPADFYMYSLFCNIANGMSCIGSFGCMCGPTSDTLSGNGGSLYNPDIAFLVKDRPIYTIYFQVQRAGVDGVFINTSDAKGDLVVIIEFIEYK